MKTKHLEIARLAASLLATGAYTADDTSSSDDGLPYRVFHRNATHAVCRMNTGE